MRFLFLALVFLSVGLSRSFAKGEIDSLRNILPGIQGEERVNVLNTLGSYLGTVDSEEAFELLDESLALSEQLNYNEGVVKAWLVQATILGQKNNYSRSLELIEDALKLSEKHNNLKGLNDAYVALGAINIRTENYAEAIANHLKGLEVARKLKDHDHEVVHLMNIGRVKEILGDLDEAEDWVQEALTVCEAHDLHYRKGQLFINLAVIEYKRHNLGNSVDHNRKALHIFQEFGDSLQMALCLGNLGFAYDLLDQPEKAIEYYSQALAINQRIESKYSVASVLINLAKLHRKQGNAEEALKRADEAVALSDSIGSHQLLARGHLFLAETNEELGDYRKALRQFKLHKAFADSVSVKANKSRVDELVAKYQHDELASENERQSQQAEIAALKARQQQLLLLALTIVSCLLGFLYWYHRKQTKTQIGQLILEKQEAEHETKKLEEQLGNAESEASTSSNEASIHRLIDRLQQGMSNEKDWTEYNLLFERSFPDFWMIVKERINDATLHDLRLASLMKLRLSNKEIGSVLSISRDSVVKAKYRLRKKLVFESNQQMENFLIRC